MGRRASRIGIIDGLYRDSYKRSKKVKKRYATARVENDDASNTVVERTVWGKVVSGSCRQAEQK